MSKQSDWYFRAHPSSAQQSINWLPVLIRMKVFKVFPSFSTSSGRQRCATFLMRTGMNGRQGSDDQASQKTHEKESTVKLFISWILDLFIFIQ